MAPSHWLVLLRFFTSYDTPTFLFLPSCMDRLISRFSGLRINRGAIRPYSSAFGNTGMARRVRARYGSGPIVGGGNRLGRGIRGRLARGRTRVLYKRGSKTTSGILGGTNADQRLVYKKGRMPRTRRRRWRRFVQKVNFVGERDLGARTVLFSDKIIQSQSNDTEQGCLTLALYSFFNSSNNHLNDLYKIGSQENVGNPTAAAGDRVAQNSKVMFQSAVMDVTIRNTSTVNNGTADVQTSEAALEMDVYEMYMRENASDISLQYPSMSDLLNAYDDPEIGGTGSGFNIQSRGCSPFELGAQLGRFRIKILKKTKYFIPNGQTITFQVRDPKRHVCRYGDLSKNDRWNRDGWTKIIYLVYKLVPGLTRGTLVNTYKDGVTIGLTRKYMYKIEGVNEPRESYYTNSATLINPN